MDLSDPQITGRDARIRALESRVGELQAENLWLRKAVEKWCRFDALNMDLGEFHEFKKQFDALDEVGDTIEELLERAQKSMQERAIEICKKKSEELYERSLRMQHHQGAAIGADLCCDLIKALPLLTVASLSNKSSKSQE